MGDEAEQERLARSDRQRAIGAGRSAELALRDQLLLTVVWLHQYPTNEVLGFLFGVSDSTAVPGGINARHCHCGSGSQRRLTQD